VLKVRGHLVDMPAYAVAQSSNDACQKAVRIANTACHKQTNVAVL